MRDNLQESIKQGFLYKLDAKTRSKWNRRYVALYFDRVVYYRRGSKSPRARQKAIIPFDKGATILEQPADIEQLINSGIVPQDKKMESKAFLSIHAANKRFVFLADSMAEMKTWSSLISEQIAACSEEPAKVPESLDIPTERRDAETVVVESVLKKRPAPQLESTSSARSTQQTFAISLCPAVLALWIDEHWLFVVPLLCAVVTVMLGACDAQQRRRAISQPETKPVPSTQEPIGMSDVLSSVRVAADADNQNVADALQDREGRVYRTHALLDPEGHQRPDVGLREWHSREHHVTGPPIDEEMARSMQLLKESLETEPGYGADEAGFCTQKNMQVLHQFLRARNSSQEKSQKMLSNALKWRRQRLAGWGLLDKGKIVQNANELKGEAETGKVYQPGLDKWRRPILVFDNHVENTWKQDMNMKFLCWNMERAIRLMPEGVEKFTIFIRLENFSLFNCPPMKVCA
jgi:hypothetical protein